MLARAWKDQFALQIAFNKGIKVKPKTHTHLKSFTVARIVDMFIDCIGCGLYRYLSGIKSGISVQVSNT